MLNSEWVNAIVCAEHPVAGEQDHERDAGELRHERQRLLLDLRRRLQQPDHETDRQRDAEDRRRELRREQDRLHRDVDDCVIGHGRSFDDGIVGRWAIGCGS